MLENTAKYRLRKYKVIEAPASEATKFKYPGGNVYYPYRKCKRLAFELFCDEFMKYKKNLHVGERHPILDCLDYMNKDYDELAKKEEGVSEPDFWCPACNWKGKLTLTHYTKA